PVALQVPVPLPRQVQVLVPLPRLLPGPVALQVLVPVPLPVMLQRALISEGLPSRLPTHFSVHWNFQTLLRCLYQWHRPFHLPDYFYLYAP
ncbi:MAG: hypothetical protein J5649_08265, partial [Lachnospiraceae bacterium]|nr:hypothetical protein [Lachnospiraceae bacterium]